MARVFRCLTECETSQNASLICWNGLTAKSTGRRNVNLFSLSKTRKESSNPAKHSIHTRLHIIKEKGYVRLQRSEQIEGAKPEGHKVNFWQK